jgi:thiosulfate/3-mercaptopyruvate sulfurtransferase
MPVLTADEAAALPGAGGLLLDARAPERFRGEVEPVDPVAGHGPGAVNLPATDLLADGRFRPDLDSVLADRGVEDTAVGVYCGSGVTAAHTVAALAHAGVEAALWPGSWSEWVADPSRPVATGA